MRSRVALKVHESASFLVQGIRILWGDQKQLVQDCDCVFVPAKFVQGRGSMEQCGGIFRILFGYHRKSVYCVIWFMQLEKNEAPVELGIRISRVQFKNLVKRCKGLVIFLQVEEGDSLFVEDVPVIRVCFKCPVKRIQSFQRFREGQRGIGLSRPGTGTGRIELQRPVKRPYRFQIPAKT